MLKTDELQQLRSSFQQTLLGDALKSIVITTKNSRSSVFIFIWSVFIIHLIFYVDVFASAVWLSHMQKGRTRKAILRYLLCFGKRNANLTHIEREAQHQPEPFVEDLESIDIGDLLLRVRSYITQSKRNSSSVLKMSE